MCENGGNSKRLCFNDSCKVCYEKSFAISPVAEEWDYEKNNGTRPCDVFKKTNKKYWFVCGRCKHSFDASPNNINAGRLCPYCAIPCKKLCEDEKCKMCHRNSFASHPKSKYWHIMNELSPREVPKCSCKKYLFICRKCHHDFEIAIEAIIMNKWCCYCSHQKLCDEDSCCFCFNNSFASHPKSKYWNYERNIGISPRYVFKSTNSRFWFICKYKHDFCSSLDHVTSAQNSWCSNCRESKGEIQISKYLKYKGVKFTSQKTFKDLRNVNELKYDFYFVIGDMKYIIEFDGRQHFGFIEFFHKEEINFLERQELDLIKTQYCLNNSIRLLRISYDCINDVSSMIDNFLKSDVRFMTSNDELYKHHLKLL
jgi:hypothetical protein